MSWTILGQAPNRGRKQMVRARCSCGTERDVSKCNIRGGSSENCGCVRAVKTSERNRRRALDPKAHKDWSGVPIGLLTVVRELPRKRTWKDPHWECVCVCSKKVERTSNQLRQCKKKGFTGCHKCMASASNAARGRIAVDLPQWLRRDTFKRRLHLGWPLAAALNTPVGAKRSRAKNEVEPETISEAMRLAK